MRAPAQAGQQRPRANGQRRITQSNQDIRSRTGQRSAQQRKPRAGQRGRARDHRSLPECRCPHADDLHSVASFPRGNVAGRPGSEEPRLKPLRSQQGGQIENERPRRRMLGRHDSLKKQNARPLDHVRASFQAPETGKRNIFRGPWCDHRECPPPFEGSAKAGALLRPMLWGRSSDELLLDENLPGCHHRRP